jgi:hypothetical protein
MRELFDKQVNVLPCGLAPAPVHDTFSVGPEWVESSFQNWLREVTSGPPEQGMARPLTAAERLMVGVATFRESTLHRRWPKDVVEKFLAVEVIDMSSASCLVADEPENLSPLVSIFRRWLLIASERLLRSAEKLVFTFIKRSAKI